VRIKRDFESLQIQGEAILLYASFLKVGVRVIRTSNKLIQVLKFLVIGKN